MSSSAKVSIVLPIYNAEPFLRQCLDSIEQQELADIEVICVNDGSTDNSLSIMREYEARDKRFTVIDKPNGGYGNSVNRGIREAHGEYVAIVEPDDFIDRAMYADLYRASLLADGSRADIVKSSYWLYYDYPGEVPHISAPNLMNCMPKDSFTFTVHTHWEVMYHHPSIWSAIYRRSFLMEKDITLIEPKGAGWADNPFFFETMLQASSIVWVPAAYYYYRQTNPQSSSNLKDYHLPFERLRDLRAIVERLQVTDPHILVCLYNREFSYIGTVINEVGFPESDSEIYALIKETLSSMDRNVLYSAKHGIHKEFLDYYEDVMGIKSKGIAEVTSVQAPRLSIVVPFHNNRAVLWDTLSEFTKSRRKDFEVICVDCDSTDRSAAITSEFVCKDQRFVPLHIESTLRTEGYNAGIDHAKAPYVLFIEPGMLVEPTCLEDLITSLDHMPTVDIVTFSTGLPLLDATCFTKQKRRGRTHEVVTSLQDPKTCRTEYFLAPGRMVLASRLLNVEFLQRESLRFEKDFTSGVLFCLKAVWAAQRAASIVGTAVNDKDFRLAEEIKSTSQKRFARERGILNGIWEYVQAQHDEDLTRAFRNYVMINLADNIRKYASCSDARDTFADMMDVFEHDYGLQEHTGMYYLAQGPYQRLQFAALAGFDHLLEQDLWGSRRFSQTLDKKVKAVRQSTSYKLGNAVVKRVKHVVKRSH